MEIAAAPDSPGEVLAKPVPGIAQSIGLCAIFLALSVGVSAALEAIKQFSGVSLDLFSSLLIQQAIAWPITIWSGLRWARVSLRESCPLRPFPVRMVPALLLASFGFTILILEAASWIPMPEAMKDYLHHQRSGSKLLILFLAVVVVAPVAEELFYRGVVLRGYLGRYSTVTAVWASALLFAVMHMNPWQIVAALPLGLGAAWLVLRTGSLLPGILCHAMINFSGNFLLNPLAALFGYNAEQLRAMDHLPLSMLAVASAATVTSGVWLWFQLRDPANAQADNLDRMLNSEPDKERLNPTTKE